MNEVELFDGEGKAQLERIIALQADVQNELMIQAQFGGLKAEGLLAHHTRSADSYITVEHGDVDWYVILDDTHGLDVAMNIEYGRKAGAIDPETGRVEGGSKGTWVLHDAFGLSHDKRPSLRGGENIE